MDLVRDRNIEPTAADAWQHVEARHEIRDSVLVHIRDGECSGSVAKRDRTQRLEQRFLAGVPQEQDGAGRRRTREVEPVVAIEVSGDHGVEGVLERNFLTLVEGPVSVAREDDEAPPCHEYDVECAVLVEIPP